MTNNWTKEQEFAISLRDTNILVSAGAGSGKTAVLVERIIALITDSERPLDIDRILVVTFTKAAAEEMRGRLHDRLSELLRSEPQNQRLQRQLALLPSAAVTTLHSFCFDIVKHYFNLVDLDAGFRIGKDYELYLLQQETLEEYIEKQYEEKNPHIAALADAYGGSRDDSGLLGTLLRIYDFVISQPDPIGWLEAQKAIFDKAKSLDEIPACRYLLQRSREEISSAAELIMETEQFADENDVDLHEFLQQEAAAIKELASHCDQSFEKFLVALHAYKPATIKFPKGTEDALKKQITALRERAKKKISDLQKLFPITDVNTLYNQALEQHELVKALCDLTKGFMLAYRAVKRAKGLVDFSDMEHYCLEILQKAAQDGETEITQRFDEVLVDEYQDINNVQETIISEMAKNGNCFMVGDIKQGIYHFRLADTELFMNKHQSYAEGVDGTRIDLNRNFRSLSGVIDAVNHIFDKLMTPELCSIDYRDGAALICGRDGEAGPNELYIIDKDSVKSEIEDEEARAARIEARVIGKRIKELLNEGHSLDEIVILMRSHRAWSSAMIDELAAMGIASIGEGQSGYLETPEIRLMMSLLQVIDNPLQDIEMAAVMRGPFGNFTADEILAVRNSHKDCYLYNALCIEAQNGMLKAESLLCKLAKWHERAQSEKLSTLIRSIYNESGFYHMVGALTMGVQRQINLNALYDRAREFESQQAKGLFRFVRFIKDLEERNHALNAARPLLAGEKAVRIMSIHHSKGLQFPIVFVAGLGREFNTKDSTNSVLLHKDMGICSKGIDRRRRITYPTVFWHALSQRIESETIAEELRILYVALTRARDKLILVGSFGGRSSIKNTLASLRNTGYGNAPVPQHHSASAGSFLHWICRVLYSHPDAAALRAAAEDKEFFIPAPSSWKINVVRTLDAAPAEEVPAEDQTKEYANNCPPEQKKYIAQLLNWQYAHRDIMHTPVKWTVTELQKMAYDKTHEHYSGSLFEERAISAADLGTAYHKVLEHIDFKQPVDINALISDMLYAEKLTNEEIESMDMSVFHNLLNSELGKRLAKSSYIEKEKAFTLSVPASYLLADSRSEEKLILQGKIDLFFYDNEADGFVIVDYKSGNRGASDADLQKRYGKQLDFYEKAVSRVYGKNIAGVYIYLLNDAKIVKIK